MQKQDQSILNERILQKALLDLVFPPRCLQEFPRRVQIDVLLYRAICRLCGKTLQRNQTVPWGFGRL